MKRHLLDELLEARAEKVPCAVLTCLSSGRQTLYRQNDRADAGAIAPELHSEIRDALRRDRSRCVETETESVFVHVFNPPLRARRGGRGPYRADPRTDGGAGRLRRGGGGSPAAHSRAAIVSPRSSWWTSGRTMR